MKNRLILLMTLILISICLPQTLAETPESDAKPILDTSGKYEYRLLGDGTAEIAGLRGYAADLVIPETLDGIPVSRIGEKAFYDNKRLVSVEIPDTVTEIGSRAFQYCTSLSRTVLSKRLRVIGEGAFLSCESLPEIALPDTLTEIGDSAFRYCSLLVGIVLPEGLLRIGNEAFTLCSALTEIRIPNTLTTIGDNPFVNCPLLRLSADPDHPWLAVEDDVLIDKTAKRIICCPSSSAKETYVIPEDTLEIGNLAFCCCDTLTSVTIPEHVTRIGDGAFESCRLLADIAIPDSVTSIGKDAFEFCEALTSVVIPAGVEFIGEGAFAFTGLNYITVYRDSYAEYYCRSNYMSVSYADE